MADLDNHNGPNDTPVRGGDSFDGVSLPDVQLDASKELGVELLGLMFGASPDGEWVFNPNTKSYLLQARNGAGSLVALVEPHGSSYRVVVHQEVHKQ